MWIPGARLHALPKAGHVANWRYERALGRGKKLLEWKSIIPDRTELGRHAVVTELPLGVPGTPPVVPIDWVSGAPGTGLRYSPRPVVASAEDALMAALVRCGFGQAQEAYAASHPWFTLHRLDAHSHFPMLEIPGQMADVIDAFVASLPAQRSEPALVAADVLS
jgi:hypothetical protein